MARRRRTSGIQRRERASTEALNRRIDEPTGGGGLPDWRLLAIGAVLLIGLLVVILALVMSAGGNPNAGTPQADAGRTHVADGAQCRTTPQSCEVATNPYSSLPATSGPHWGTPANWGVYSTPQSESQLIHNLEHGGIVIWHDSELDQAQIAELARYVEAKNAQGTSGRYKFILSPWAGDDLPAPVVVTGWQYLLELEEVDTSVLDGFAQARYGRAPEPAGGP